MRLRVSYAMLINIARTNKDFIFIDYKDDKVICYRLSNDMAYKKKFDTYRVVSTLKNEIRNLTINI